MFQQQSNIVHKSHITMAPLPLSCASLPALLVNWAWERTECNEAGRGGGQLWGWDHPCPLCISLQTLSPLSICLSSCMSHPAPLPFPPLQVPFCPCPSSCPSLLPSPCHALFFLLSAPSISFFPLPHPSAVLSFPHFPLPFSLPACALLLMCSNGMAGKSFALPFSLFFSRSIIKTAPSLAVMGASVFSPSPVSLTWHNACPHQDAITPR